MNSNSAPFTVAGVGTVIFVAVAWRFRGFDSKHILSVRLAHQIVETGGIIYVNQNSILFRFCVTSFSNV